MLFKALISMNFELFGIMERWDAGFPSIPIFQHSNIPK